MNWEIVESRMPNTPQEIATGWKMLVGMVKADLGEGLLKDWGSFPGDKRGYCILEGSEMDVMAMTTKYAPYVRFDVKPVTMAEEVAAFLEKAAG